MTLDPCPIDTGVYPAPLTPSQGALKELILLFPGKASFPRDLDVYFANSNKPFP